MKKLLLSFFVLFFLIQNFQASAQTEYDVNGVILPRFINFQNKKIQLNGFGTRSKLWMDVYVQALYLTNLSQDAKEILESNTEMAIRIQITSSLVTSEKFSKSLNKGLLKSVGKENIGQFKEQIELLESYLGSQKTVEKDYFNLIYNPIDTSIWVYKNETFYGKVPGFDFKKAFFGIWLSDNPVDDDLKNELLGK